MDTHQIDEMEFEKRASIKRLDRSKVIKPGDVLYIGEFCMGQVLAITESPMRYAIADPEGEEDDLWTRWERFKSKMSGT